MTFFKGEFDKAITEKEISKLTPKFVSSATDINLKF